MMTISEMKERKKELCYTSEDIAERSGVPLSTVQKIFCGATKNPRYSTLEALEMVLKKKSLFYEDVRDGETICVREEAPDYRAESSPVMRHAVKVDCWTGVEPTEKWPGQGGYTIADIEALPDDIRVELIDGYIYELASPSAPHQRAVGEIYSEFKELIKKHNYPCEVFVAPSPVTWEGDDRTEVQPDIQIRCLKEGKSKGASGVEVRLVIEVLSPSTALNDCTIKLRKYMTAGVKEYWIVDPDRRRVMVYCFDEGALPVQYSFDGIIPVGISGGQCSIDFGGISRRLDEASRIFGDSWF